MKKLFTIVSMTLIIPALTSCGGGPKGDMPWIVDRFDDIKVIRYEVPGFDELPLEEKELVYYLAEAAKCGRDILFDQNCAANLPIRRTLETLYLNYKGDRTSDEWKALEKYLKKVWFANGIHHHYSNDKFVPEFPKEYFLAVAESIPVEKFGDEAPIEGKGYFPSRWPHATYAAMITYFDRQVGGLVAELKRLGIWDDTIIVVTSDNGPASNSCSSTEWFQSAHPFRSGKGWGKSSLREGGIRMPFIVAWGDRIERPHVNGHVGYFPDVMPTLCDIAGVETPPTDGISLWPTIRGKERRQQEHDYLYWEFPGGKGWVAVRWGDWKGLLRKVKEGNTQLELYDVRHDLLEEHDVAADHPDMVARMWEFIRASHTEPENPLFKMEIPEV